MTETRLSLINVCEYKYNTKSEVRS